MFVGLLIDTISEIMKRMNNFPPVAVDSTTNSIVENIKKFVEHINNHLLPLGGAAGANLHPNDDWLGDVNEAITDLFDLVDDLSDDAAHHNPSKMRSLFSLCNLKHRSLMLELKAIEKRLEGLAAVEDYVRVKVEHETEDTGSDEFPQDLVTDYNKLPSWHQKRCWAYSSLIFWAYGGQIDADTLIRLWMAEGFLGPTNSSSPLEPEDLGCECIQEFCRKDVFYGSENELYDFGIPDLSAFVAEEDSLLMDDPDKSVKKRVRRVLMRRSLDVSNGIPTSLFETNKKLRTFYFQTSTSTHSRAPYEVTLSWSACDAIFTRFKRLRVLKLGDLGMKMLPSSIGKLKSLRYLDLSRNNMKKLPNSIGELKHLQTLNLSHCHELKELPNDVKNLMSLRHLELTACLSLTHMPLALKYLSRLRTLTNFVASTGKNPNHSSGLRELTNLNNLRGELEISHLERLTFKESDQDGHAYLKEKQHLQCLTLRWNHNEEDDEDNDKDDQIVLELLEPHSRLPTLSIVGYQGDVFSKWLSSLENLCKFCLYNCSKCKSIPSLDQLPHLKTVQFERLDSLEYITDQDDGYGSNVVSNEQGLPAATKPFFPSLKELTISDCPKLTSWWKRRTENNDNSAAKASAFPFLSTLKIQYCPSLSCMPLYPNLDDELVLECSSLKPLQGTLDYKVSTANMASDSRSSLPLSNLKGLTIANVEEQSHLPQEWLKNFSSLEFLLIMKCKDLKSLIKGIKHLNSLGCLHIRDCTEIDLASDEWEGLKNLFELHIMEIPELQSLPEGIKHLTSLYFLEIESCPELTTLTEVIGDLESLGSLLISECHNLAFLPQGMKNLESLWRLTIRNCPLLSPRCQKDGQDWEQIKHIRNVDVEDTYQDQ